jgi:hypothetical protein
MFSENWLPGTDSKSRKKHREFTGFLISADYRYPQKHPLQKVAVAGGCRIFGDADPPPMSQTDHDVAGHSGALISAPGGAVGAAP